MAGGQPVLEPSSWCAVWPRPSWTREVRVRLGQLFEWEGLEWPVRDVLAPFNPPSVVVTCRRPGRQDLSSPPDACRKLVRHRARRTPGGHRKTCVVTAVSGINTEPLPRPAHALRGAGGAGQRPLRSAEAKGTV